MRECDPNEQLANKLIRTRAQIAVSQNTSCETQALTDVLLGMNNVLEYMASSGSSRRRMGWNNRAEFANRIALIIDGLKRYTKLQISRIETFACCVEALGDNVKPERGSIAIMKEKMAAELKELDGALVALKDASVTDKRLMEIAQQLQDQMHSSFQERSTDIRDMDKRLREKAEHMIVVSLDNDKLVRKIAKAVALPTRDDPGTADLI